MNNRLFLRSIIILLGLALTIGFDQASKAIVRNKIKIQHDGQSGHISLLDHHFTLLRVENSGAFLSLGDSLSGPVKTILLNILPLLAVAYGLFFMLTKTLHRTVLFALILIVGGGIGNLYDRIVHGSVTDFMHIKVGVLQTGVFNVADMSIMAGMFIILFHAWFKKKEKEEVEVSNIPEEGQA
jgi:signal peptidase II